jgi:hypothetical protein
MTEARYRCDRCGRLIGSGRAVMAIEAGPRPMSWPMDPTSGRPALDLCGPYLEDPAGWLHRSTATPIMIE